MKEIKIKAPNDYYLNQINYLFDSHFTEMPLIMFENIDFDILNDINSTIKLILK